MTTITDYSQKDLPQNIRDMLDGKHDGRALDGKSLAQDVRDLDAAKARLKKLLGIEGKITGDALYNLAADEIETLRAQVQEFTADALVRAHRQCIAIDALIAIRERATNESTRQIAAQAVAQIEAVTL